MVATVHRLHMANLNYLDGRIDVYSYLVIAGSTVMLIDTGIGADHPYIEHKFAPRSTPIASELARFGLETTDVDLIVNSHLHFDHCGNNRQFPHAEIFVQSDELAVAHTPRYTVEEWFDYDGARLNPISGNVEISAGVTLLPTPGHTPGHQSVLVETEGGHILVAAQAAYTAKEYQRGGDVDQAHDGLAEVYLESISKLKSVGAEIVYFSHDDEAVTLEG